MKYYLFLNQGDEGCDYTIGCGQRLIRLNATSIKEARTEVNEKLESYGIGSEERMVDEAMILSLVEDVQDLVQEHVERKHAEWEKYEKASKRAMLEKLKKELGE